MLDSGIIDIPEDLICPITQEIMENPVVAADGHSYEQSEILEWLQKGKKVSPLTGEPLKHDTLIENHRLRAIISGFKERLPYFIREQQIKLDFDVASKMR